MIDVSLIITGIVPPIFTAIIAFFIAKKRNDLSQRIGLAKVDAEIQSQALNIVRVTMTDMKEEFRREIDELRKENKTLKTEIDQNKQELDSIQEQLIASDELVETLRSEISTLKKTINVYEDEIERLKQTG